MAVAMWSSNLVDLGLAKGMRETALVSQVVLVSCYARGRGVLLLVLKTMGTLGSWFKKKLVAPLHPRMTPIFHPRRPCMSHLRDFAGFVVRVDFGPAFKSSRAGTRRLCIAVRATVFVARAICVWWRLLLGRCLPPTLGGLTDSMVLSVRPLLYGWASSPL